MTAHIEREIAARPELVQIETTWRHPKEQRPGALHKAQYRELDQPENPGSEPAFASTRTAIVVFSKQTGRTLAVCTDPGCPIHEPRQAARRAGEPAAEVPVAPEIETEEEAAQRKAEHEQRRGEFEAGQELRAEERRREMERQEMEHEADRLHR